MKRSLYVTLLALSVVGGPPQAASAQLTASQAPQQSNITSLTDEQRSRIQASLSQRVPDNNINAAISEATPVISEFLSVMSCMTGTLGARLNKFAAPGKVYDIVDPPAPRMRYHNKGTCVSVLRIQGWKMPAKNALQFEASFVSDASGEVLKYYFEVVKQPNGEWLFTK